MDPRASLPSCTTAFGDAAALARRAAEQLDALVARARHLAEAVRWEAPSARAYRGRADELREGLARAAGQAWEASERARTAEIVQALEGWA
jgi:hypothetical protein